jgi:cytochrome P450
VIDAMLAGPKPVDLVKAMAYPVPARVICELLGVPYADDDFLQNRVEIMVDPASTGEVSKAARQELVSYLERLIADKRADPGDDLLSDLANEHVAAGALSQREAAMLGLLLVIAGHETTANMITLGTLALLENPDQLAVLRATEDPKLIAGAVEELLRYLTIPQSGRRRVAVEDIEIGEVLIRGGEGLILASDLANRDESVFDDPDRLDLRRPARRHASFGGGPHQCLGQPLARVELQIVYPTLFRRIPTLRRAADLDQIPFKQPGESIYGVCELPVTWGRKQFLVEGGIPCE